MFARLVLIAVQLFVGYIAAVYALIYLKNYSSFQSWMEIFIMVAICPVVVWFVGLVGFWILRDVGRPTPSTFALSLLFACALAAVTTIPEAVAALNGVVPISLTVYPLVGAVIGYAVSN